jgi:pimeloyl-ACP methyl ester carboxylesterase
MMVTRALRARGQAMKNGSYFAELNGFTIRYELRGRGPVLMTLPNSWGLTHQGLRGLYRPLEKHVTMVYFDPRGMGESAPLRQPSDMGLDAVRKDFDALRRHLGLERVNAIGWSNGAMNLIRLASEYPETISSAIFVHGLAKFTQEDERLLAQEHGALFHRFEEFLEELEGAGPFSGSADARFKRFYVREYFPACCADPAGALPILEKVYRRAKFSWAHTKHCFEELPHFDFRDRLGKITARALVVAGAKDLLPPERVREMAEKIPGAEFICFQHSGHFAPVEERDAFVTAILKFLASDPERGQT